MERKAVSRIMLTLLLTFVLILASNIQPLEADTLLSDPSDPLFNITIIAPGSANLLRRQWGQMFADSLKQLGINATVVFLGWAEVYDRVFTPPPDRLGKTYDEGGFDIQLVGWSPDLVPEPRRVYYGSPEFFAPNGLNYYLWNNTQNNLLLDEFITTVDPDQQNQTLQAWQSLFINELPCSQIFYSSTPAVVTPELTGPALSDTVTGAGEGWLYFNAQPNPELLTGKTSVVYASTGEIESLIPILSNSWYDTIIYSNIHSGLVTVHPDLSNLALPNLLTSWTPYNDGFNWNYTCRTGVTWHDGEPFTADDVVFSYWAALEPTTGTQHAGTYTMALGDKITFTFSNGTSWVVGNGIREGFVTAWDDENITLSLPELIPGKPYGFIDPNLLGLANNIMPKHIFEQMDPADWTDSPFNTGEGSIDIGGTMYTGPVGTGPYKWVDFDPVAQLVHLEKFDQYWNKTALEADGLFGVTDYYIRFIADKTPALAALKNEEVDMLDSNYMLQENITTIEPDWGKVLLLEGMSRQEAGYNMRHPVFGSGVDTPLGQSDPSRAAEAARYVRIAFDYAIQRQLIIDNLLVGFGQPGATPIFPTQPYHNSSIISRPYDLSKAREYLEKAGYKHALCLSAGWSTVSFARIPDDPSFSNILSGVGFYLVLTWDGTSYVEPDTAEAGRGYWILVLMDTTVTITDGVAVESYELDLPVGWSMIGSILPCTVDADCVFPGFYQLFTWDGKSYVTATTIEPGKGYWALVLEPTHIIVDD